MTYVITGVPRSGTTVPPRRELSALVLLASRDVQFARQLSLYIKALSAFQKLDPNDELSYYRIAGIHGDPDVSWDGVGNPTNPTNPGVSPQVGWWCAHNRPNFLTWHRPYLALFEQRIYEVMLRLIGSSNLTAAQQAEWRASASQWRLPYWDWAKRQDYINPPSYGVPQILTQQRVRILDFNGAQVEVENPLWKFSNPRAGATFGASSMGQFRIPSSNWGRFTGTSRCPNLGATGWQAGQNNWQQVNSNLQRADLFRGTGFGSLENSVYRLLLPGVFSSWVSFETAAFGPGNPGVLSALSLEYVHNSIHMLSGGSRPTSDSGHMVDPSVAAFDPIFWLHHCNIDRLAAIFQTLNPNLWYTNSAGTTPLVPFHRTSQGAFWTSNECRNWTVLGYTYDNLTNVRPPGVPGSFGGRIMASAIPAVIPDIGSAQAPVGAVAEASVETAAEAPAESALESTGDAEIAEEAESSSAPAESDLRPLIRDINQHYGGIKQVLGNIKGHHNDYIVNIIYDRYALNCAPYTIYFFLGEPITDPLTPEDLLGARCYLGSVFTFSSELENRDGTAACHNCNDQKNRRVLSSGQLSITAGLLKHARDNSIPELETLERNAVTSYLEKKLHWVAIHSDQSALLDISAQLPHTKIFTLGGTAHYPETEDELPVVSNYSYIYEATKGKAGGAEDGEEYVAPSTE